MLSVFVVYVASTSYLDTGKNVENPVGLCDQWCNKAWKQCNSDNQNNNNQSCGVFGKLKLHVYSSLIRFHLGSGEYVGAWCTVVLSFRGAK